MDNTIQTTKDTGSKVCFSYIRFSSRIQKKGDSERRQLEIAPRVAKEKGWTLREDLNEHDLGLSAFHRQNLGPKGKIPVIVEGVKSGKVPQGSVMIIEALDRLTRTDIDEAMPLLWELLKAGLEIYIDRTSRHLTRASLKDPVELTMALFELKGSYEYSAKLSKRVGDSWKQKKAHAAEDVKLGRMTPAWIDCVESKTQTDKKGKPLIVDFKENANADTVRRIFNSYANGKGIRTIMRELNNEGVSAFGKGRQNKGAGWSNTHLRRLLNFRGVLGEYQPCNYENRKRVPTGAPIADYYPAIVDKATFYKVQEMLPKGVIDPATGKEMINPKTGRRVWQGGRAMGNKDKATNLFTGIVKCAKCGASMVIKQSGKKKEKWHYTSLICSNATRGKGCGYHTIQYPWVERAILTVIWSLVIPQVSQNDTRQDDLAKMQGELKNTQAQLERFKTILKDEPEIPKTIVKELNLLETKETALQRQIESLSATINDNPLTGWKQVPQNVDNRLRLQAILANEIDSLTIDAGKLTATLTLKDNNGTFEMQWQTAKGTNKNKISASSVGFWMFGKYFLYLDDMFVWESKLNVSMEMFEKAFVPWEVQPMA